MIISGKNGRTKKAIAWLSQGGAVGFFPYSSNNGNSRFHAGFAVAAVESHAPIFSFVLSLTDRKIYRRHFGFVVRRIFKWAFAAGTPAPFTLKVKAGPVLDPDLMEGTQEEKKISLVKEIEIKKILPIPRDRRNHQPPTARPIAESA
jgi:hypothetical protein